MFDSDSVFVPADKLRILISDKTLPRVTDLGGQAELKSGQEAWLVWEGTAGVTYLVRTKDQTADQRSLITFPKKDVKRTEIIAYDSILRTIFCGPNLWRMKSWIYVEKGTPNENM